MSATITSAQAILKRMFAKGAMPNATYTKFAGLALVPKMTDLGGDDYQQALQNENPQAAGSTYADASGNFLPGTYNKFLVTRIKHYSLCRIQGDAMDAARAAGPMAFIDLWKSEMTGAGMTEQKDESTYLYGNGSGARGQISAGSNVASTTISLTSGDDIIYFDLNMRVTSQDVDTVAAVTNPGSAVITGISRDPANPQLTIVGNWNASIPAIATGQWLARAGDSPSGGTARVITGLRSWFVGGTTPGTLFGLNRNTDPVRLAGQSKDYTTVPMEEAVIDADALMGFQGSMVPNKVLLANNRDIAQLKKALSSKIIYDRAKSDIAGVSFKSIQIEGDYGPIQVVADPFCRRGRAFMLDAECLEFDTMGPIAKIADFDGNQFLRVGNDDAYEARFLTYGFLRAKKPSDGFFLQNFGS
jgi:hypothetical protein